MDHGMVQYFDWTKFLLSERMIKKKLAKSEEQTISDYLTDIDLSFVGTNAVF